RVDFSRRTSPGLEVAAFLARRCVEREMSGAPGATRPARVVPLRAVHTNDRRTAWSCSRDRRCRVATRPPGLARTTRIPNGDVATDAPGANRLRAWPVPV